MAFQASAFQHGLITPGFQVFIATGGTGAHTRRKPEERKRRVPAELRPSALFKNTETKRPQTATILKMPPRVMVSEQEAELVGRELQAAIARRDQNDAERALAALTQGMAQQQSRKAEEESEAEAAIAAMLLFDDDL